MDYFLSFFCKKSNPIDDISDEEIKLVNDINPIGETATKKADEDEVLVVVEEEPVVEEAVVEEAVVEEASSRGRTRSRGSGSRGSGSRGSGSRGSSSRG